jgi:hypothetical protein
VSRPEPGFRDVAGPWPFVTRRLIRKPDGTLALWESRRHRKGLLAPDAVPPAAPLGWLWRPGRLNWWIGLGFSIGAFLFLFAAILGLAPVLARTWGFDPDSVNRTYFAGSIFFTAAAFAQLNQAANAPPPNGVVATPGQRAVLGWRPGDAGWLGCVLQFAGTLAFNLSTWDETLPDLGRIETDLAIWVPDLVGSVLFLVSGWLAFIETCHAHWAWRPQDLSWRITAINLGGCIAFLISAVFGYVPRPGAAFDPATLSTGLTALGALGFLIGGILLLAEDAAG